MSRSTSRKSLTPESLVSVLVPHISQQTLLLPSLHEQLGLPPSALESDLSALREALLQTVENCVNNRKKEISEWNTRCEAVEERCRRLENALGRRAASLGDIKKQPVYPVRHEQLSAQEEKLKQLYKSKFEQLNVLTTRLSTLSYTLGPSFFSDDVLNPTPAPGELDASPIKPGEDNYDHHVDTLLRDVTPERFNRLEKELVRGKAEINRRLVSLSELFEQIALLYTDLEISLPSIADPIPSTAEFPYPRHYQSKVATKSDPFSVTPAPDPERQRREYFPLFAAFATKIQQAKEGEEIGGVEGVDPTPMLIEWFERLRMDLEEEKSRREARIQSLYDQLEVLWKRLGITDTDIDDFVQLNCGSGTASVRAYEMELERMLEMKRERMSVFIGNARAEIERLWDDLMWSEEERETFIAFHDDEHTEDLLVIHEEEIVRLKEERRSKAPILVAIRKYYQICDEQKQLEESASDQSRLLGRGARGDPGRLLREERMRKRVQKEKPRLEQELLIHVPAWEEENGKPLLVNGIHFLGQLQEAVRAEEAKAESKKRPRTNSNVGRTAPAPPPAHSRKLSAALSIATAASTRSASGSSHASTALSMSTASTSSSVLGPASKRQKLNNAFPNPVQIPPVSTNSTITVLTGRGARSVPQRPASRTGTSRSVSSTVAPPARVKTPVTMTRQAFPTGGPGRPPSRAESRSQSPSKLAHSSMPMPALKNSNAPSGSTSVKSPLFPVLVAKNGPSTTLAMGQAEGVKVAAKKGRRESFRPRPSSPGLGREYTDMWRGRTILGDQALSEDSEAEL